MKKYFSYLVLTISIILFLYPTFSLPLSLIDDGQHLLFSKNITSSFFHEADTGRVRPAYWLLLCLRQSFLGTSGPLLHLSQFAIVLVTFTLLYKCYLLLSKSKLTAIISSLVLLFFYPISENYYRLGPQEPTFLFFISISLLLLIAKKHPWLSYLSLYLSILSKETSLFLLPFFAVVFLFTDKSSKQKKYFIHTVIAIAILLILKSLPSAEANYATAYKFSLSDIIYTYRSYLRYFDSSWLTSLIKISLISYIGANIFKVKQIGPSHLGLLWFVLSFLILIPWSYPIGRYLVIPLVGLSLFIGYELNRIISWASIYRPAMLLLPFIFYYLSNFFFTNITQSINIRNNYITREKTNQEMVSTISQSATNNANIFFNFIDDINNYEWISETGIQLKHFYSRPDLTTSIYKGDPIDDEDIILNWSEVPVAHENPTKQKSITQISQDSHIYQTHLGQAIKTGTLSNGTKTYSWKIIGY